MRIKGFCTEAWGGPSDWHRRSRREPRRQERHKDSISEPRDKRCEGRSKRRAYLLPLTSGGTFSTWLGSEAVSAEITVCQDGHNHAMSADATVTLPQMQKLFIRGLNFEAFVLRKGQFQPKPQPSEVDANTSTVFKNIKPVIAAIANIWMRYCCP